MSEQLDNVFKSSRIVLRNKLIITSPGTYSRNNLGMYIQEKDLVFNEVLPNPSLDQLIDFLTRISIDSKTIIVAIGGGSVIDFAKLVSLFYKTHINDIKEIIEKSRFSDIGTALPILAVPTLYGSGAEKTPFAVCYIDDKKYSVSNPLILPQYVEYITELNLSAPRNIKLANVLDCFCQAFESLTSKNATRESIDYATEVLNILVPISYEYIHSKNIEATSQVAFCSDLCGRSIAISKTTGPHALSYYLTSKLKWDHGIAVSLCMLYFLDLYQTLHMTETKKPLLILKHILNKNSHNSLSDYFIFLGLDITKYSKNILRFIDIEDWYSSINIERLNNGPEISDYHFNSVSIKNYYTKISNYIIPS